MHIIRQICVLFCQHFKPKMEFYVVTEEVLDKIRKVNYRNHMNSVPLKATLNHFLNCSSIEELSVKKVHHFVKENFILSIIYFPGG